MNSAGMTASEWLGVIEAMEEVAPYYERVNQLITFGLADAWRAEVARRAGPDDVVLEIGSGPGNFARHLEARQIYCIEPSGRLISMSKGLLDASKTNLIRGVGERVPLANESVDKVFCSFSFRDFRDREEGTKEMYRVLKDGGEVFIADVAKPPPGPMAKLLQLHVRHVVPMMARMAVTPSTRSRWRNDPYRKF
ncbi:MAG: class I SAM-dependent methyltransferase, partial [Methanobacteriota archaeon]